MSLWLDRPDDEVIRTYEMGTGTKAFIKKTPPHGFWVISFERGNIPDVLSGQYTEFRTAHQALTGYLATRRNPTKLKELVEVIDAP